VVIKMNKQKQNSGKGCLIALRFWRLNRRAQSAIEFAALILFILAAFLVFQKYIARGLAGRWKGVGDILGQERIYDANSTIECEYHPELGWFDRICFETNCRGTSGACSVPTDPGCESCISSNCRSTFCDD